jgi:hypothetical protein
MPCLAALRDDEDVQPNKILTGIKEFTEQDGTEAEGNPTTVYYTEKVMLKQLGADSVSSETMTLYNSLSDKVGVKKWKFHVINFG